MLSMLIAYDANGDIIATEDVTMWVDHEGRRHIIDAAAHEAAGGKLRQLWHVTGAVGSSTWPEWLGEQVHEFRVEVDARHKLRARRLVHKVSGHVRHRDVIEAAIAERIEQAQDGPADLRDIVGGPGRPIHLDRDGVTVGRPQRHGEGPAFLRHAISAPAERGSRD